MDEAEDYIYEYLVDEGWNPPARPVIRSTLKKVDGDVDAAIDELWARLEAKDPSLYGKPKKADKPSKEPKPKQAPKPQDPIKGKPFEKEVKEAQVVTSWDKARESVQKKKAELRGKELKRRALVESKIPISLVFAGHVDAGKSTLMGHLLVLAGKIGDRTMHKFDKESKEAGKHSFRYAWILDSGDSERFRGVTVDVGTQYFETERRSVTLLDAPGHKDFVPNMISGASQADYAVLVIDASPGEFERSFLDHAQTKEHALLLKSAGIDRIILLINKLDSVKWNQARYEEVSETVIDHLKKLGYKREAIIPIPCSGLLGENIFARTDSDLRAWYYGPTLVQAIDGLVPPSRSFDAPLRYSVTDVVKNASGHCTLGGTVDSGTVTAGEQVVIMPVNVLLQIKGIRLTDGSSVKIALAGEKADLILAPVSEPDVLSSGQIVCEPWSPIPLVDSFEAKILTVGLEIPIVKGTEVIMHVGSLDVPATISKLIASLNPDGTEDKLKPRCITSQSNAKVRITLSKPMCLDQYTNHKQFGRFCLRKEGKTIAVGVITSLSG